ncbi:hypothetical protein GCM10020256_56590 [Streptomyces thermocoprophilus]
MRARGALLALPLVQAAAALAAELPEKPDDTKTDDAGTGETPADGTSKDGTEPGGA